MRRRLPTLDEEMLRAGNEKRRVDKEKRLC